MQSTSDQFGGVVSLAEVRLQEGESLENALRRFKRKVQQEDIIKEVKRHSFYLKPGEKRRVKEALARKRSRNSCQRAAALRCGPFHFRSLRPLGEVPIQCAALSSGQ
jgi:small subunit ribosomal protein S21